MGMKNPHVTHKQASSLLHNKFVVVLGGSIERGMYKDLVLLLQRDNHLSLSQLKTKGEEEFENDELLKGGRKGEMTNGVHYKEVRQYTSDHHLVRFYFLTRIYSGYVQTILEDFENGLKPDLVIVNSCVWDVSRYGRHWESDYLENLTMFFGKLRTIIPDETLIIWNLAMPLSKTIFGGFLVPEITDLGPSLRFDIIEANYCSATLANAYGLDVLDLHFQFRFSLQHRMKDGVHWNAVAHRRITCLLLEHVANAWGVELPPSQPPTGMNQNFGNHGLAPKRMYQQPRKPVTRWRTDKWRDHHPLPATSKSPPYLKGVTRWRTQKRRTDNYPLLDTPLMALHNNGGFNPTFPKGEPGIEEVYQQPTNAQNSVTRWRAQEQRNDYSLPPASLTKPFHCVGVSRWSFQERRDDCDLTFDDPSTAPRSFGGVGRCLSGEHFATNKIDQQPRNVQNSVTRWRPQERRQVFSLPLATPTKPLPRYGGLNQIFSKHDPATDEMYQQPRSAQNAGLNGTFRDKDLALYKMYQQPRNAQSSVIRFRLQERRADYSPLPDTPSKAPCCYGVSCVSLTGLNQSFNKQDPATTEMHQQPTNAQNSATRWRPEKRKADHCLPPASCLKAPCYYEGQNLNFLEEDPSTSRTYQQPRNTQSSVTRWRLPDRRAGCSPVTRGKLQDRRAGWPPLLQTPSMSPYCHRGLKQSFNQQDLAIHEMYQQPRNTQSSVTRSRLQEWRTDYSLLPGSSSKAPHCYGGLNLRFNERDPGTNEMYQQPRCAQYAATGWRPQERRLDFSLPPITAIKPSLCYGGQNRSFREEDSATRKMHQQPRNALNSVTRWKLQERRADDSLLPASPLKDPYHYEEPAGFDPFRRCPNGPYTYKQPDFRQPHFQTGDNCGYVMRKKYFRHAQYRPY